MDAKTAAIDEELADSYLGFRLGDWGFLLPISTHCEVLERLQVNPIPNVEPWFSGLLNVRGLIVPVIDLGILLGVSYTQPKQRYLFTLGRGEKTMAVWIDSYPQLLSGCASSFLPTAHETVLPGMLQTFVAKSYVHNDQVWLKVQFEPLFKTLGQQQAR